MKFSICEKVNKIIDIVEKIKIILFSFGLYFIYINLNKRRLIIYIAMEINNKMIIVFFVISKKLNAVMKVVAAMKNEFNL